MEFNSNYSGEFYTDFQMLLECYIVLIIGNLKNKILKLNIIKGTKKNKTREKQCFCHDYKTYNNCKELFLNQVEN